jgi:plasmid stabilization system protein ParE
MVIEVKWTVEAQVTFEANIKYLLENWTNREVQHFIQQTEYVTTRLKEHPESYNPSLKNKKVRRARLNKYVTLYYRYYASRKQVVFLSFWNTRQDPGKLKH